MLRRIIVGCLVVVAALAIAGTVLFATVRPFRTGVTALALVPAVMGQGPDLLSAFTPSPTRTTQRYGQTVADRLDIYLPGSAAEGERLPAVLLALGVNQVALDHPAVVRTAMALARVGLVVAVPADAELAAGRIGPEAPAHLVEAVTAVAARPEVDPDRVGLAGFSAGASMALIAATDPRIADRLAYVNAFGAYADARTLLAAIASRTVVADGRPQPWQPGELARRASLELILGALPDEALRDRLRAVVGPAILAGGPPPTFDEAVAATLDGDAQAAYRLLTAGSRAAADAALADLTPVADAMLEALSPVPVAGDLRAPVFLMHDVGDDAIPFAEMAPLASAVPATSLRLATAFEIFDHVQPDAGGIGLDQVPDLLALFGHLQALLEVAV